MPKDTAAMLKRCCNPLGDGGGPSNRAGYMTACTARQLIILLRGQNPAPRPLQLPDAVHQVEGVQQGRAPETRERCRCSAFSNSRSPTRRRQGSDGRR